MQNKLFSLAKGLFSLLGAPLTIIVLAGCVNKPAISNITAPDLASNPSQIYTISARIIPTLTNAIPESTSAQIVIDGHTFDMKKSPVGKGIFEFDYQLPVPKSELKYYFIAHYQVDTKGIASPRTEYSEVQSSKIVNRYITSLDAYRGYVGSKINILGRGFSAGDIVTLDGVQARTEFISPNSISFYVPALDPNRSYKIEVINDNPDSGIQGDSFYIDAMQVAISPNVIDIASGESQLMTFSIPTPASHGGLLLDVTTDVPDSIILPVVAIEPGRTSVQVYLSGGVPGKGHIYLKGYGDNEIAIPVTIR